ncbi:RDD family protein [Pedobacter cryoconitis]|uniref:Putative RDD family membrane protein YckC n=1 Tax=Pedobacter cryoconitis TaxID=188932 RepID=A0A7X0J4M5_9SPHI|nr:RDD family protein [Pedobacter cryoconitis]MBB6500790.1 putative RDD family membrane protein YckC [Pedobacter cryoconitis]
MEPEKKTDYIIVVNGKPEGPYNYEQLKNMAITAGTFVRKPGMDDYKEAHEFPELRALFGFNYEQTAPQYFASFDQRLLASMIDYFILLLLYIALILISFIFISDKGQKITIALLLLPFVPLFKFLYGVFADASVKQGTIGKRLLNIKVTDSMGNRISLSRSLIRNGAKILSVIPLFFGYLYSFLNKKQQCWHDVAADTLVIKDRLI